MNVDIHAKVPSGASAGNVHHTEDFPAFEPSAQPTPFVSEYTPYSEGATNIEIITKTMADKK